MSLCRSAEALAQFIQEQLTPAYHEFASDEELEEKFVVSQ